MTYLCVPIFVSSLDQAKRDAVVAAENGADLVVYRVDEFTDAGDLYVLVNDSPLPCILTLRSAAEGGRTTLADDDRIALLKTPGPAEARYIDLELETFNRAGAPKLGGHGSLILSA